MRVRLVLVSVSVAVIGLLRGDEALDAMMNPGRDPSARRLNAAMREMTTMVAFGAVTPAS